MTTKYNFNKYVYGDYRKVNDNCFRLVSLLPSKWHYFKHLTWFGPRSLYQDIKNNYSNLFEKLKSSVNQMIPTINGGIDLDQIIIRDEPKYNEESSSYDFIYINTPKAMNIYSDLRMSGYKDHYVLIPLDETYRLNDFFSDLCNKYFEIEFFTKKIIYGLAFNEILHQWWHGSMSFVPMIKSFKNDERLNKLDIINDYIPTDIVMDMDVDREYIVFEKLYVPISNPLIEEYVKLMNYLIDGSSDSTTRILSEDENHSFKVVLSIKYCSF